MSSTEGGPPPGAELQARALEIFDRDLAELSARNPGRSWWRGEVPGRGSTLREPPPSERAGHRSDRGAGIETFSMRLAAYWLAEGERELLALVPYLEELELALREPGAEDAAEAADVYRYPLF